MYFVKMIRLRPPWVSSKTIKTNNFFSENCKNNICFYYFVEFFIIDSQKYLMQILPIERRCFFFQALTLQIRGAAIKKRGFVPIFFESPSENHSCKARKYKLQCASLFRFFGWKYVLPMKRQSPESETKLSPNEENLPIWRMSPIL